MEIHEWNEIAGDYTDGVILGNGASIAIDLSFSYSELLTAARENGLISTELDDVFDYIKAPDFELALTMLWHAYHVNRALGVTENKTTRTYEQLRLALVKTVKKHHVPYADVIDRLHTLAEYLKRFTTVASLNYDLLVYWAMMAGNQKYGNWFKDAFINDRFRHKWDWLRDPFGAAGATMVFYPHGNLALATDLNGEERKLKVSSLSIGPKIKVIIRDLLDEITKQWDDASVTPLFVSEGTSEQKLAAISRSTYLRNVFDEALPHLGDAVAVFGWSASEQDRHILEQVLFGSRRFAFSVTHRGGVGAALVRCNQITARVEAVRETLKPKPSKPFVQFYWAESDGTWGSAA